MSIEWLQTAHLALTAIPWILALWVRQAWVILICIAIQILLLAQWLVVGHCVLNPLENDGSTESFMMIRASEWFGVPLEEFKRGFVLINSVAPSFFQMGRLAGALHPGTAD
jgi:hypothetical protein